MVELIEVVSKCERDTIELGLRLGGLLLSGDVVAMRGGLGSGKTVLARGILRGLGVGGNIQSPSFIMIATYRGKSIVNHIDLYRIERSCDLESLGLEEKIYSDEISLIEWAEKIEAMLPSQTIHISIESLDSESMRLIKVYAWDESTKSRLTQIAMDILRGESDVGSRH